MGSAWMLFLVVVAVDWVWRKVRPARPQVDATVDVEQWTQYMADGQRIREFAVRHGADDLVALVDGSASVDAEGGK